MKHLNQKATAILDKLVEGLTAPGNAKTWDAHGYTKKWDGGIMAVHVENIGNIPASGTGHGDSGNLYSVTHYYKQNGDMMRDPEMIFWHGQGLSRDKVVDTYYPTYFRMDPSMEEESVVFEDGKLKGTRTRLQADHAIFANMWMKNIKEQQGL
uniref:DUF6908 domain-containing protein n=1 Tax=viral metagenome TaxID=1070528 RepID=A0A6M3LUF8_9ZZZZ